MKKLGKVFHYKAGKHVFQEGETGKYLYHIIEGTVEILKGDTVLREMSAGETFGELGILRCNLRTATVYAKTDVTLEAFDRSIILSHLKKNATVEEKRAANNLINYIDKLDEIAVGIDKLRSEIPGKDNIATYSQTLSQYIEKDPEAGKILKNILKFEDWVKTEIIKKIEDL